MPGITVDGRIIRLAPQEYFFRQQARTWKLIDWEKVTAELLPVEETSVTSIEQITLDYITDNARTTENPAEVLATAWRVYSYLFRAEYAPTLGLDGITEAHLRMLAEVSTFTALNKVEQDGRITNVGPCWFFADAAQVVFELDERTVGLLDEVYHGGWFNENRRIESVKAHAALGGRLVHGCQSVPDRRGGAVAPYGTPMDRFRDELAQFRDAWSARA
ncbi:hypothetical protein [Salinactinospora qingdaonensis]